MTDLRTFNWKAGDHAAYCLGDAALALSLAGTRPFIAADIETAGLGADQWTVKAVSFGTEDIGVVLDPDTQQDAIREIFATAHEIVLHNSPFDIPILVNSGLMRLGDVEKVYDTIVTARMAHPSDHGGNGLGQACTAYLGGEYALWKSSLEDGFKAVTGWSKKEMFKRLGLTSPAYVAYAAFDVIMTSRLRRALPQAVTIMLSQGPWARRGDPAYLVGREQTVNRMLLRRSCIGFQVDFDVIDEVSEEMAAERNRQDQVLFDAGIDAFNLSPAKLKEAVVDALDAQGLIGPKHRRTNTGRPSADARLLEKVAGPLPIALKARSEAERFIRDYANKLIDISYNGRVHPQVAILAARTGRMSYGSPPLQQFPAGTRRMIRFDGPAVSMDWASIEPVLVANFAGDLALLEEFESGGDLYLPIASAAGVSRDQAKTILLAQLYGQGFAALGARLGLDEAAAKRMVGTVMGRMPEVKAFINRIKNIGSRYGVIGTMSGRILPIDPDPETGNTSFIGYTAINYLIQGSAYDMLAEVLVECHRRGLGDTVYVAMHDELIVADSAADEIEQIMVTPCSALTNTADRVPVLRVGRSAPDTHWNFK